tara:strand:+ start:185 stop:712 length:528 start_codon:yes stop_codon:yes gene_type:complete
MKSPNEITNSDLVAIGSIGKSHGLNGSFFLNSYCDPEENFFTYERFFLIQKNKILELSIKSKQIKSSKNIINISGIESVDEIKKLTNSEIYTLNKYLKPEDGEYYWKDLLQLEVYNENNELLGVISEIRNYGANDTLIIKNKTSQLLIPFVKDVFIKKVDLVKGILIVNWNKDEL